MNLKNLDTFIGELLDNLSVKTLPNLPNISGIFNQSDITYAIIKGESTNNNKYVNVNFQLSVSNEYRMNGDNSLYDLMFAIIYHLEKRKFPTGGLIKFISFELFTPESGKWRSLMDFEVEIPINNFVEDNC